MGQDKAEAYSPYATAPSRLLVKLSDFGFSSPLADCCDDDAFRSRARSYGLRLVEGQCGVGAINFAVAEDLHALGFVFLGSMLSALAEVGPVASAARSVPPSDEDSLQRLLGDIFDGDFEGFREYALDEEAWSEVSDLLDENEGAGWDLLRQMCGAREKAGKIGDDGGVMLSARGLLRNPIFGQGR